MNDKVATSLDRKTLLALVEASRAIISELELRDVFARIAEQAAEVLRAEGASVLVFDADRNELVFQAATGAKAAKLVGERFESGLGIAGQAVKARRTIRVDDVRDNRNFFPGIDAKTTLRTRCVIAAPLIHADEVLGVVELVNAQGRDCFDDRDVELVEVFANLAAAAASQAQAFDRVKKENRVLRESSPAVRAVGASPALVKAMELCRKVAGADTTVLLYGETGTGKEVAARSIHSTSKRKDRPFVAINCAALPETLLESELFGHEKGAFTGAVAQRQGRFELASGGTLFLDEIGEMGPSVQAKLLRVVQEREFVRLGGSQVVPSDVRIIAATNRDLKKEVEAGRFREDLYYRLNVFPITLPPLRDRPGDVPALVDHFLKEIAPTLGVTVPTVSEEAMALMIGYRWPGNIRELRNVIERCALLAGATILPEHLPPDLAAGTVPGAAPAEDGVGTSKLADHERVLIVQALNESGWNQSDAARRLGITRDLLRYRMKKYSLKKAKAAQAEPAIGIE